MKRKLFGVADGILILFVLLASLAVFCFPAPASSSLTAVIRQDNTVVRSIALAQVGEGETIVLNSNPAISVRVESDGAWFLTADCPDHLCVRTGRLTRAGQSAVCLPARVSLTLEGETASDSPDAVTG